MQNYREEFEKETRNYHNYIGFENFNYAINISLRYKYVYVETPKAACSTIKTTLQRMELDAPDLFRNEFEDIHLREFSPLLRPSQVGNFEKLIKREDFKKFCFVRNPYTRILSAYLEKVCLNKEQKKNLLLFLGLDPIANLEMKISFEQFVKIISQQSIKQMDPHWRIQYYQTMQDAINYDFIGKVENFSSDFDKIMKKINPEYRKYYYEEKRHSVSADKQLTKYYNPKLRDIVYSKYKKDFDFFGYDPDISFSLNSWHSKKGNAFPSGKWKTDEQTSPLVSVVIPCYNQATFLPEAIDSVLEQSYPNIEIIVVNDGSPDNTSEVVSTYQNRKVRFPIFLLEIPNGGLANARNVGIKQARGAYILPLDADDKIHPEMIRKMVEVLEQRHDLDIVYSDTYQFGEVNGVQVNQDYNFSYLLQRNHLNYCSLFRRKIWENVGGYSLNLKEGYEDWDFWIKCGKHGAKAYRIPEPLFFYRVKEKSMYTEALAVHDRLKAQIILNHKELYSKEDVKWAHEILYGNDHAACNGAMLESGEGETARFPHQVHFLMNDKCNANCIMCGGDYFYNGSKRKITLEKFKQMARNLHLEKFKGVVLSGAGDPLLNPDLIRIIEFLNQQYPEIQISITTNGIALSKRLARELLTRKVDIINVSINSATPSTYKRIMQVDRFQQVYTNIRNFTGLRAALNAKTKIQLSSAINYLNIFELPEMVQLGVELNVDSFNVMYCRFYPENIRNKNVKNIKYALKDRDSLYFHQKLSDEKVLEAQRLAAKFGKPFYHEPLFRDNAAAPRCVWHETELMVGFDGEVYPCGGSEVHFKEKVESGQYNFGNALTQKLEDFWNGEMYRMLRVSSRRKDKCFIPECQNCANKMAPNDIRSHIMHWDEMDSSQPQCKISDQEPMVSVIVPTYNRPELLKRALQSLAEQTFSDFEVIVVNDAGEDVQRVISEFESKIRITYISHEKNSGLAATRNTGIRMAKGKYIAYLDDDDIYYPHHLQKTISLLEKAKTEVVYSDAHRLHMNADEIVKKDVPYSFDFDQHRFLIGNYIPVLCVVHAKSCIDEVGYFDESLPVLEDWDLWIRMAQHYTFKHLNEVTCAFSWRSDRSTMTSRQRNDFYHTTQLVYAKYWEFAQDARIREGQFFALQNLAQELSISAAEYHKQLLSDITVAKELTLQHYQKFVQKYPKNAQAWNDLAVLNFHLGRWEDCVASLNRALELEPQNKIFRQNREYLLQIQKMKQKGASSDFSITDKSTENRSPEEIKPAFSESPEAVHDSQSNVMASIIIPAFNQHELTKECLTYLFFNTKASFSYEVIVVDDGSDVPCETMLSQFGDRVRFIRSERNKGFAATCNLGARYAKGKYLIFLNNDTKPLNGWLEQLIKPLERQDKVGIVGAKLIYPGTHRVQHAGKVFRRDEVSGGNPIHIYYGEDESRPYVNKMREFQTVTAAAMAIAKSDFEQVNGFDESYRNGWEDDDLCFKVRFVLKKKVIYNPRSVLYHRELATRRQQVSRTEKENRNRFMTKWDKVIKFDEHDFYTEDDFQKINVSSTVIEWRWQGLKPTSEKKKILFVLLVHAGDVLLSTAVVREVRRYFPNAEIHYATAPAYVNLLETNPNIQQVIPFGPNRYSFEEYERIRDIIGEYDYVFYLQNYPNRSVEFEEGMKQGKHLLDMYSQYAGVKLSSYTSDLIITAEDKQVVDRLLRENQVSRNDRFFVFQFHSRDAAKDWPRDSFFELIQKIKRKYPNHKIFLIGGRESQNVSVEGVVNTSGRLSFRQSAELIRRCELFIGIDSIGSHLAALFNKKSVILFGDTPPSLSAPINDYAFIVRSPQRDMSLISVDEVFNAVQRQLEFKKDTLTSVIIVTFNSEEYIENCIRSVQQHTRESYELIVVDNCSRDKTLKILDKISGIQVIRNKINLGFSKAVNQGIEKASGDYIVLLNPDTVVFEGWDIHLKAHFTNGVGAVGPVSNFVAGLQNLDHHKDPGWSGELDIEELATRLYHRNRSKSLDTKLLIGFCLALRRETIERVGLLDEDLFLGNDDLDYSLRLREAGYSLKIATDTFVYHAGHKSFSLLPANVRKNYMQEAQDRFYEKLEKKFGKGKVPASVDLWGIDILGVPSRFKNDPELEPLFCKKGKKISFKRIALIYDNTVQAETIGNDCLRAIQRICDVEHIVPAEIANIQPAKYDLFLYIDDGLPYEVNFQYRPNAWWTTKTHRKYKRDFERAKYFDYIFVDQKESAQRLKRDGIRRVFWLPPAADPNISQQWSSEKKYDVALVGDVEYIRGSELLEVIQNKYKNVFVVGAFSPESGAIFSQSKVVVHYSIRNELDREILEALACNCLVLTNCSMEKGLPEMFEPGTHLVTYSSATELLEKIDYYLKNESEREKIAQSGRQEVASRHTYHNRLMALLQKVDKLEKQNARAVKNPGLTSIIIVTYNGKQMTQMCVESIRRFTTVPYELIVVDNGSSDGTVEYLRTLADVKLIENGENRGFAAANNQGIRVSRGDYIVLLNNDIIVTEGWLERMIYTAELAPDVGLVGPKSNFVHDDAQLVGNVSYDSPEAYHTFAAAFAQRNRDRYFVTTKLVGFCLLIKRRVVEKIGLLDESYGLGNFEDDDYCVRARLAGFHLVIAGDVFIHHEGNFTFKENKISYQEQIDKNLKLFKDKWKNEIEFRGDRYFLKQDLIGFAEKEVRKGEMAFRKQEWQKAKSCFEKALEWHPEHPVALNNLGVLAWQQGDLVQAKLLFEKAVTTSPHYRDAWDNMLSLLNRPDELLDFSALLLKHANNEKWATVLYDAGARAIELGDLSIAEQLFAKIQELAPRSVEAQLTKAQLLWTHGEKMQALAIVKRLLPEAPQYPDIVSLFVLMALEIGEREKAEEFLKNYIKEYPNKDLQILLNQISKQEDAQRILETV